MEERKGESSLSKAAGSVRRRNASDRKIEQWAVKGPNRKRNERKSP